MRFEFYHSGLDAVPKLSVDGTVPGSVHFSHWHGNETAAEVKADTSTEIALNLIASPRKNELTRGIELVTNNHFDTDGVLSVWTMLNGERAIAIREELISAAEAGDFSEFPSENAVRASIVIQGSDQPLTAEDAGSPLANQLAGTRVESEAKLYELVLPEVERVITRTANFEKFWRQPWQQIANALESFASGKSSVRNFASPQLSLVNIADDLFGPAGFDPSRHAVPFTAISHNAKANLFLIAIPYQKGWAYRLDYPYYSWAETVTRPRIKRRDWSALAARLNQLETNAGSWTLDSSELSSAAKFSASDGKLAASALLPDQVAKEVCEALPSSETAAAG